jgi:hydroxymethylbilane synthase
MPQSALLSKPIRLGTRGSPLALYQAHLVRDLLTDHWQLAQGHIEIVVIETKGDRILDRPLYDVGGKGLFIKAIEEALLESEIDLAVHSMKDVPSILDAGFEIAAILEREDVRDALIAPGIGQLLDLPSGCRIGTSSPRRRAQLKSLRPDLDIRDLRGNVDTRLGRVTDGTVQATILASAGLKRLGKIDRANCLVPVEQMLPAAAQGAIGIEIRLGDERMQAVTAPINHGLTAQAVHAERAVLAKLGGSCLTPVAAYAQIDGGRMQLAAKLFSLDGSQMVDAEINGAAGDYVALGQTVGAQLLAAAPPGSLNQS